jgi:hypothetical protein
VKIDERTLLRIEVIRISNLKHIKSDRIDYKFRVDKDDTNACILNSEGNCLQEYKLQI